jgi:hypothetical protein
MARHREGNGGAGVIDHVVKAEGQADPVDTRDRKLAQALHDIEDVLRAILSYPDVSAELAKDLHAARDLVKKHVPADLAGTKESRRPRNAREWIESIQRRAAKGR